MPVDTSFQSRGAIARAGAILLIAASAALGTYFGYQTGDHYHWTLGLIFAGAALGGELIKPFAMQAAIDAIGRWSFLRALVCLAVALVCIAYSLASELALSASSRGDLAAERRAASSSAADARAGRERATAELATLKPARPVAELEPLVATARERCRIVVTLGSRQTVCSKDPQLLAELGRAKRRAELEATVAKAIDQPAKAEKEADPLAAAVAFYLAAAGVAAGAKTLSTWLYLVPVIFLEIGSAFGLVVAAAASAPVVARPRVATKTVSSLRARVAALVRTREPATVAKALRQPSPRRQPLSNDGQLVVAALKAAGRPCSNDELAAAMGCHKGEASKRVAGLAGVVRKVRQGRHVAISLVH